MRSLNLCPPPQPFAEQYKIIVVAPDSGNQQRPGGWDVPLANMTPSSDIFHAQVRSPSDCRLA